MNSARMYYATWTNADNFAPHVAGSSALRTFGVSTPVPTSSHPPVVLPQSVPTPQQHPLRQCCTTPMATSCLLWFHRHGA